MGKLIKRNIPKDISEAVKKTLKGDRKRKGGRGQIYIEHYWSNWRENAIKRATRLRELGISARISKDRANEQRISVYINEKDAKKFMKMLEGLKD